MVRDCVVCVIRCVPPTEMVRDCVVCVVRCVPPTEMVRDMRGMRGKVRPADGNGA
jgi:hypothetical protein